MNQVDGPTAARATGAWNRFWFSASDPSTLGFMRIIAGLVVIYVHLAYSFDLQAFFGKHGWVDLETKNRERREIPFVFTGWDYHAWRPSTHLPDRNDDGRRRAVIDFLKHLPDSLPERKRSIKLLQRYTEREEIHGPQRMPFEEFRRYLENAGPLTSEQKDRMASLMGAATFDPLSDALPIPVPAWIAQSGRTQRVEIWNETQALLSILPVPSDNLREVLNWFGSGYDWSWRKRTINYMVNLPLDNEKRAEHVDYFAYWNYDQFDLYTQGQYTFSLWFHLTDPTTMAIAHGVILGIFVLFTLGWYTRVTSVLTWVCALFYIHRTQEVLFGMDTMMIILLFYLMIGPSGSAFSLDRLRARYRASKALLQAKGKQVRWAEATLAGPIPSISANVVIRLFQIHFCIMYLSAGLSKLKGTMWWDTTSNWLTIANPEFSLIYFTFVERMLDQFAANRVVMMLMLGGMNYFTLGMEIALPFLIWTRARPVLVIGAILLHSGIAFIMGLTAFGLLMMTILLSFTPAGVIRNALGWRKGSGEPLHLHYDSRNADHIRAVSMVRSFDTASQVVLHDESGNGQPANGMRYKIGSGPTTNAPIAEGALRSLVLLRSISLLFMIPGVRWLFHRLVGNNG